MIEFLILILVAVILITFVDGIRLLFAEPEWSDKLWRKTTRTENIEKGIQSIFTVIVIIASICGMFGVI